MIQSVLITGANSGLGKDAARQLALQDGMQKIYLACRNEAKAEAAKADLEQVTGMRIFEIVRLDVSNLDSVRSALGQLPEAIDAVVLNAGGIGGKNPGADTAYGVKYIFAVNVLGHVLFLEELLKAGKVRQVAIYAGSEASRGISKMGVKKPAMKDHSVEEFISVMDGSFFGKKFDPMVAYSYVKYMAALWMSSLARQYPQVRLVTVSPGGTSGTEGAKDLPFMMRFMFKTLSATIMPLFGLMHKLETGAKRYVDVLNQKQYQSGAFYASKQATVTGPVVDQGNFAPEFRNRLRQDNAHKAIRRVLERATPRVPG